MEWTFFTGGSAAAFRRALHLDAANRARGRGWALWKALLTIGMEKNGRGDAQAAARRFGWRHSPRPRPISRALSRRRTGRRQMPPTWSRGLR